MTLTTSSESFEIKEIGTWVYLLKDNKLFSGEITEVNITQFSGSFGNMKVSIRYKIADSWYLACEVFSDVDGVMEHLKDTCKVID